MKPIPFLTNWLKRRQMRQDLRVAALQRNDFASRPKHTQAYPEDPYTELGRLVYMGNMELVKAINGLRSELKAFLIESRK
jgi:hypothetical protein